MAKEFDKGVQFYTTGVAEVKIHFPENDVRCKWCPFCRSEQDLGRYWCRLTNEMLYSVNSTLGDYCPIIFESEDK